LGFATSKFLIGLRTHFVIHPTQIFLSNPQALRVEYRLDDQRLEIWWSPKAGKSTDCHDRNLSSRDAHLNVFCEIEIPGCGLEGFDHCDYDPYHSILFFANQTLHLALRPDLAALFVWAECPQTFDFKMDRSDDQLVASRNSLLIAHSECDRQFEFAAWLGEGGGVFRHGPVNANFPCYSRATLCGGQLLVIGVGLVGDGLAGKIERAANLPVRKHLADTEVVLAAVEMAGHVVSSLHPELEALRRKAIRGLHSMIDESGTYRASLKAIYYLIWVRDGGFSFPYQASAGWTHKLPDFCRFLLDNPLTVREVDLPQGRMFGQLIHRDLGKLEEDGLYYVVRTLFTQWTQNGPLDLMTDSDWLLIDECLAWIEQATWDEERGLYGSHFADETPTLSHRDHGWDHAVGKPIDDHDVVRFQDTAVVRNYDVYFNILQHSTLTMLAAMRKDESYLDKASRAWPQLNSLLRNRRDGIPDYGEVLLEHGERCHSPYWGQAISCCVWGLTLPNFAPLADWDAVLAATMDAIIAKPEMHFINGICSAITAVDTWYYPEDKLIALHQRLATETNRPGKYLPMGGAMPEKFAAPEGDLHHDIRPQGFAMGAWLAAWSSLGLRRLPYGLALRPTTAFERIENYAWRGRNLHFQFGPSGKTLALEIDGKRILGTLQVPEDAVRDGSNIRLVDAPSQALWLSSSVQLNAVSQTDAGTSYRFTGHGSASITLSKPSLHSRLITSAGDAVSCEWNLSGGMETCHFAHFGEGELLIFHPTDIDTPSSLSGLKRF